MVRPHTASNLELQNFLQAISDLENGIAGYRNLIRSEFKIVPQHVVDDLIDKIQVRVPPNIVQAQGIERQIEEIRSRALEETRSIHDQAVAEAEQRAASSEIVRRAHEECRRQEAELETQLQQRLTAAYADIENRIAKIENLVRCHSESTKGILDYLKVAE
ncbi:MAG: hypothetical protein M1118_11865 [Chloroflexi bacterium]|nr:hypothetical protein [Chloroflexota bacterium]